MHSAIEEDNCLCVHEVYTKVYTLLEINKLCFATCAIEKFAVIILCSTSHSKQFQLLPMSMDRERIKICLDFKRCVFLLYQLSRASPKLCTQPFVLQFHASLHVLLCIIISHLLLPFLHSIFHCYHPSLIPRVWKYWYISLSGIM